MMGMKIISLDIKRPCRSLTGLRSPFEGSCSGERESVGLIDRRGWPDQNLFVKTNKTLN